MSVQLEQKQALTEEEWEELFEEHAAACATGETKTVDGVVERMRRSILWFGLPVSVGVEGPPTKDTLRGRVWKVFLGVGGGGADGGGCTAQEYRSLLELGECTDSVRRTFVRNECSRYFPKEKTFHARVSQASLRRACTAVEHKYQGGGGGPVDKSKLCLLQGMAGCLGVFMMCMPEVDAFFCFSRFLAHHTPTYWLHSYAGVYGALELLLEVLSQVDPQLHAHLEAVNSTPGRMKWITFFFGVLQSLGSTVAPLSELMQLWDMLVVTGFHYHVVCVAAQIVAIRSRLLRVADRQELNTVFNNNGGWPPLRARYIVAITMSLIPKIHKDTLAKLEAHCTDAVTVTGLVEGVLANLPETDQFQEAISRVQALNR